MTLIPDRPQYFGNGGVLRDRKNPYWGAPCDTCDTTNAANVNCEDLDDNNIQDAVDLWFSDQSRAIAKYGHISDW